MDSSHKYGRYTRQSNGFSRKLANHAAATTLNYFAYNFINIHRTLRTNPAIAAGVTDHLWSVEDLVALWEAYEQRGRKERREEGASKSQLCALGGVRDCGDTHAEIWQTCTEQLMRELPSQAV